MGHLLNNDDATFNQFNQIKPFISFNPHLRPAHTGCRADQHCTNVIQMCCVSHGYCGRRFHSKLHAVISAPFLDLKQMLKKVPCYSHNSNLCCININHNNLITTLLGGESAVKWKKGETILVFCDGITKIIITIFNYMCTCICRFSSRNQPIPPGNILATVVLITSLRMRNVFLIHCERLCL